MKVCAVFLDHPVLTGGHSSLNSVEENDATGNTEALCLTFELAVRERKSV